MTSENEASPTGGKRRRVGLFAAAAIAVTALDLVTKILVVANLPQPDDRVRLLGGAIYLQQIRNSGAAFSLGTGFTIILTAVAVIVALVLIRIAGRLRSVGWALAFGLILGGAVGNLIDRFFRSPGIGKGHVVDFVSVFGPDGERWPIFNVADSGIVVGAVLAAVLAFAGIEFDGRRQTKTRTSDATPRDDG